METINPISLVKVITRQEEFLKEIYISKKLKYSLVQSMQSSITWG